MPEQFTEAQIDQILQARREGKLPREIARTMNEPTPPPPPDDGPTDAERAAAAGEAAMSRGGLPAGEVPEAPLGQDLMRTAAQAGGYIRGDGVFTRPATGMSDRATAAGFTRLFERAQAGDPEAVYKRADESWADAKARHDAEAIRQGR
jgi:hypothetical protein